MAWEVEYTDQFQECWESLTDSQQEDVAYSVNLLRECGPTLKFPHSSDIKNSRHGHMRELRTQSGGDPIRFLYAFDPLRIAILLIGGEKTGDDRWYEKFVPIADDLYDEHIETLKSEGLIKNG